MIIDLPQKHNELQFAMQEAAYLLCRLDLRGSSRSTVKLGIGFPKNRIRIVTTEALRDAGPDKGAAVAANTYDYYQYRLLELAACTLFEFLTKYGINKVAAGSPFRPILLPYGNRPEPRYIHLRRKAAVPRLFPQMTEESHDEEYFYSMLSLHTPWRREEEALRERFNTYKEAFQTRAEEMQGPVDNEQYASRIEAAVIRLRALEDGGAYGEEEGEAANATSDNPLDPQRLSLDFF
jgi:hypothetical protein